MLSLQAKDGTTWDFSETSEIGRAPDNAVRIQEPTVGAKHARLVVEGEQVLLVDLNSTNGTWVNGQRLAPVQPQPLKHGDQIRLGGYDLTFWGAMKTQMVPEPIDPTVRIPQSAAPEPQEPAAPVLLPQPTSTSATPAPASERTVMRPTSLPFALVRADGTEHPLEGNLTIGRKPFNGLQLGNDAKVSEVHSKLEVRDNQVIINDAGSSNGTWVNGKRINAPTKLRHGDSLLIGDTKFRLRVAGQQFTRQPVRAGFNPIWGAAAAVAVLALAGLGWTMLNRPVVPPPLPPPPLVPPVVSYFKQAQQSTVLITVSGLDVAPNSREVRGLVSNATGSGVIVDRQRRYILTAWHLISPQVYARLLIDCARRDNQRWRSTVSRLSPFRNSLVVKFNADEPMAAPNQLYTAELVGYETINLDRFCSASREGFSPANDQFLNNLESMDVALIRISEVITGVTEGQLPATRPLTQTDNRFTAVQIGNSDQIRAGSSATVLGFPEGTSLMKQSKDEITGIDIDRGDGIDSERDWFTTDTPIRPGNSGGPVLDANGKLIGIALQLRRGIPSSLVQSTGYVRPLNTILTSPAITRYWNPSR